MIDNDALEAFRAKVQQMAKDEFGPQYNNYEANVEVICVDRTRCRSILAKPIPYFNTEEQADEIRRAVLFNLKLASADVSWWDDLERSYLHD